MGKEREQALARLAEGQRSLEEGLEAEVREDLAKARGDGRPPKRPWWKIWGRT